RTAVYRVVLGSSTHFHVAPIVPLQPGDKSHPHARGEIRILTIGLLAAAPAWIAKNVDVGRPEIQTLVAAVLAAALGFTVLGTSLVADGSSSLVHQPRIERRCKTDGLRKDRGRSRAGDTVKGFVPPLVGGNIEPG